MIGEAEWPDAQRNPKGFRQQVENTIPQRRFAEVGKVAAAVDAHVCCW